MTLLEEVVGVCAGPVLVAIGGSVFYFVKGTLRSSSKGARLASGVQEVVYNRNSIRRGAAWAGTFMAIALGVEDALHVDCLVSLPVAWATTNTLFSVHKGAAVAVHEGLKGAIYGGAAGIAIYGVAAAILICQLVRLCLDSEESCNK